eukprot:scaffold4354_cov285-Alexandrium_tamarense.AAC.9
MVNLVDTSPLGSSPKETSNNVGKDELDELKLSGLDAKEKMGSSFLARNSLRRRVDLLGSVKGNELDCTRRIRAKLNVQHVAIDRLHL